MKDWITGASVLLGFVGVMVGYLIQRRKAAAEGIGAESVTAASLFAEVGKLRGELLEAREESAKLRVLNFELTLRVASLEAALPVAALAAHLGLLAPDTAAVLDECGVLVILSPDDDGKFRWVSRDLAKALGRSREEIIALGWRALIHPDDLTRTINVEGSMWGQSIKVVNRYLRADGGTIWFRWYATKYLQGVSLAHAKIIDPPTEDGTLSTGH